MMAVLLMYPATYLPTQSMTEHPTSVRLERLGIAGPFGWVPVAGEATVGS